MDLNPYFKSIIENDITNVVICNLQNEIIYMNPAAIKSYKKRGGEKLIGKSLLLCHNSDSCEKINRVVEWFGRDKKNNRIFAYHNPNQNKDVYMVALRDESGELIGYYEKHEYKNSETETPYNFN